MGRVHRIILIRLILFTIIFVILLFYYVPLRNLKTERTIVSRNTKTNLSSKSDNSLSVPVIYLWCIVVKIENGNSALLRKFKIFFKSLLEHAKCSLSLNVLTDDKSKAFVEYVIEDEKRMGYRLHEITFYDIKNTSARIKPVTEIMQTHFSSVAGTYYSDSLFYISLGLHEIAPLHHREIVLVDIDIKFETSVAELFEHFSDFTSDTLFAMAPELSPVYHHILWKWKQSNPNSSFGEPSYRGFSGLNSGVMLLNLNSIRNSEEYRECITRNFVDTVTDKYMFKGHLGDQDFYTLLAMEKPHLIKILPCTWNRQLCQWWKHHGYDYVFDDFARCDGKINIYHGNCNTPIPAS